MSEAPATHVTPRVAQYARERDVSPAAVMGRFLLPPAQRPAVEAACGADP